MQRVCPTHKAGAKRRVVNYLPISVLPALSTIFEISMFNRLYNFLRNKKVLYKKLFGFQPKRSITDVLIQNYKKHLLCAKEFYCRFLLDIKKATDTNNHSKLLQKTF